MPVPKPNPVQEKPAPAPSVPPKCVNAPQAAGAWKASTRNGSTRPISQTGWVHACTLASAPMPLNTIGITMSVVTRYPISTGSPIAWCMAWAMIEPSRAKKMKVKEA